MLANVPWANATFLEKEELEDMEQDPLTEKTQRLGRMLQTVSDDIDTTQSPRSQTIAYYSREFQTSLAILRLNIPPGFTACEITTQRSLPDLLPVPRIV
ncbi:hypothetical protein AB6A40_003538 [Gnathostoma spinigerum]|uniref:Uncharacterized protein n=1 Tax=Gnathostoma spinigerum TaxID=75299 RepID=A0ABD6E9U8_9BILA